MVRVDGTYLLMADVFSGQRLLCFPLSYYNGEAYLLGIDDDYCAPFGNPITDFGLINEEKIVEEIAKTSPEYSASKMYWSNYRLKRFKLDYGKCYHFIYRPRFLYTFYLDARESIPNGILSTELYEDLPVNNFQDYSNQLRQLEIILSDMAEVFKVVAPHSDQFSVYGHAIRNIIILACTELDARMQSILANNGVKPRRKYFEMKDYFKLKGPLKLDEYELSFYRYSDLGTFSPFSTWENDELLYWYQAYNHIKHNREKHFAEAKLFNAINAIMAYAIILIAQYGYRNNLWHETVGKIIHIEKEPKWDIEDFYIKNPEGQIYIAYPFQ